MKMLIEKSLLGNIPLIKMLPHDPFQIPKPISSEYFHGNFTNPRKHFITSIYLREIFICLPNIFPLVFQKKKFV
jgi:hypothetical protein